jgi:hypothetical protein
MLAMRKTAKEIVLSDVAPEEMHTWLGDATAEELKEFLRWAKADSSWALHGRDYLNAVLANENIKLQKDIRDMTAELSDMTRQMRDMTKYVTGLTIVIAILTLIQVIKYLL